MIKLIVSIAVAFLSFPAFAECNITWSPNDPAENVTEYRLYYNSDGTGFVQTLPSIDSGTATTCSAQGILQEVGHVGLTAVNAVGESEMATAAFPPGNLPGRPTTIVITIP